MSKKSVVFNKNHKKRTFLEMTHEKSKFILCNNMEDNLLDFEI